MNIFGLNTREFITTSDTWTATDQFLAKDGTDTAPGYSFTSDRTIGLEKSAAGEMSFVTGGAKRLKVSGAGTESKVRFLAPRGLFAYAFESDTGTAYGQTAAGESTIFSASVPKLTVTGSAVEAKVPVTVPATGGVTPQFAFDGHPDVGLAADFDGSGGILLQNGDKDTVAIYQGGYISMSGGDPSVSMGVFTPTATSFPASAFPDRTVSGGGIYAAMSATSFARFRQASSFSTTGTWGSTPAPIYFLSGMTTVLADPCTIIAKQADPGGNITIHVDSAPSPFYTAAIHRVSGIVNWSTPITPIGTYSLYIGTDPSSLSYIGQQGVSSTQEVRYYFLTNVVTSKLSYYISCTGTGAGAVALASTDFSVERLYI